MILVDTGPLVALFNPRDAAHVAMRAELKAVNRPLVTTIPVLTEATHLLGLKSKGTAALCEMVSTRGLRVWFLNDTTLIRAFDLMHRYRDHPMDLADASLVCAAEALRTTDVLTLDRGDFHAYRARIGRTSRGFRLVGPTL